jgi:GWxTD domain-containing protein
MLTGCMSFSAARINDIPAVSKGDILFYIDFASFKGSDAKENYVEFYIMLFGDQLREDNGKFSFGVNTVLTDKFKKEISRNKWETEASVSADVDNKFMAVYDQWQENLKPGDYSVKINIRDITSGKSGEAVFNFTVNEINSAELSSSSIEFASRIEPAGKNDYFTKGSKSVIPNPSRRYGLLNPILYFYYELYNIQVNEEDSIEISYSVRSKLNTTVKNFPSLKISKRQPSTGITHGLNVGNLQSGIYDLYIDLTDFNTSASLAISRQFEVIQKDFADRRSVISAEDTEIFENLLSVIGTEAQLRNYRTLSQNAKGSYMVEFWKSKDPTPGSPENEYLQSIQQRYIYANQNFGWGMNEGWKTDRGRILIKYGMPDEIDSQGSRSDTAPYEVWVYRQEKRFMFVFGDPQSNGRFILLHSDREGEIYNERGKDYLKKM